MALYQEQFEEKYNFNRTRPRRYLVIASTPRCGSHMLGHTLHQTERFGFPLEYANSDNLKNWRSICGTNDTESTVCEIMNRRTSPNGVFAIKLHYSHIANLGGFDTVKRLFPNAHYVLLTRSNALSQAISFALASQTGIWIDGQEGDASMARYDRALIDKCLRRVLKENAAWRYLLAANGCRHIEMDFDSVKEDIAEAIKRIANFSNIEMSDDVVPAAPVTRRQGGSINREWARRYLEEYENGVLFPEQTPGKFFPKLQIVKAAAGLVKSKLSVQIVRG